MAKKLDCIIIVDIEATCWQGDPPAGQSSEIIFSTSHLNAKTLFALWHRLPRELGMARALALLELPLEGAHHRGGDDAWNIAALVAALFPAASGRNSHGSAT